MAVRSSLGPRKPVVIKFPKKTMTKQSFKDSCNINKIMEKYAKSGQMPAINASDQKFEFASSISFTESMQIITDASQTFDGLPARMRQRFGNNPALFLEFVENPANRTEMGAMGLLSEEATEALENEKKAAMAASEPEANAKPASPPAKPADGDAAQLPT